ncbi:MAG TPA: CAP domain-containing protein [Egibacteraceae bacterium]|nr:CAP domain-containing protein [Egibacteraceae bacterium]
MLLVALIATLFVGLVPAMPAEALTANQIRDRVYTRINKARQNHGLRALRVNPTIEAGAQSHARDMARRGSIYHDPNLGAEVNEVLRPVWWYGENVGWTTTGKGAPKRLHRAFMKSAGHRANILKKGATHMGLGVVKKNGNVYIVERFVRLGVLQ